MDLRLKVKNSKNNSILLNIFSWRAVSATSPVGMSNTAVEASISDSVALHETVVQFFDPCHHAILKRMRRAGIVCWERFLQRVESLVKIRIYGAQKR